MMHGQKNITLYLEPCFFSAKTKEGEDILR